MIFPRLLDSVFKKDNGNAEYDINHNGLGPLSDAISCRVVETKNSFPFSLEMQYPVGGINWESIDIGKIIVCKPSKNANEQPFKIYSVSKEINGKINISARHISNEIEGVVVRGFNSPNSIAFSNSLLLNAYDSIGNNPVFNFSTDIFKAGSYMEDRKPPRTLQSVLIGKENSFLSIYGGEFVFDGLNIMAKESRGKDNGFTIRPRKNLVSLVKNQTLRDFATAVYPYWCAEEDGVNVYRDLPEKVLNYGAAEYSDIEKVVPLDLSSNFDYAPSEEELRNSAIDWINKNFQSSSPYNLTISFEEDEENVNLCDTITVICPEFNIFDKLKVIRYTYNVLQDKCESIVVGDPIPTFNDTLLRLIKKR